MIEETAAAADDFAAAEQRYRVGAYAEAAAMFERLAQRAPGDAGVSRMLGLCRLRLGDPAAAVEKLAVAHALAPADPYARLHYGMGLLAVGRAAEAAAHFAACEELLPGDPAPYLNHASALLALGEAEAARDLARRARRRAPHMPQAHYTLGLALLALARFVEAAEAFLAAAKLDAGFAEAWVNLGVARYRAGNIEGAKAAMRQALAVAPGHRAAAANLGAFLRLTGEMEAGEALLRDLVARDPGAVEARLNLAADLLMEQRAAEALALLGDIAPPGEPRLHRHWLLQHSLALIQLGRRAEAQAVLAELGEDVPAEVRPLWLWRRVLLAAAEGEEARARALAREMAAALEGGGEAVLPEHRIMAHYDLADFWSRRREVARTFAHWREGHRLLGLMQPFSRAATRDFVDANTALFDRARLHQGARAQNRDTAPVFIVGMPRSGTTLCEQIIAAHPQAHGAGERGALRQAWWALGDGDTPEAAARIAGEGQLTLDAAAAAYLAELHALAPGAARIVDKMPGNFSYLGLATLLLPGARIIHCARDPRDIGLSIFTYRFYGWHPYAHDLADLGWYIGEHLRLMRHWHNALPNPVMTVRLQDWVEDFDGTLQGVLDFLELPWDPACARFYEQTSRVHTVSRTQVRQPVNARGLGRWRPYAAELKPLLDELAAAGALPAA